MNHFELRHYHNLLLALRDRVRNEIPRMAEVVLSDATASGEHDRAVSESADKELVLEHTEEDIRSQVSQALQRLNDGTFGRCQTCNKPISKQRLDVIPYTSYCIACERAIEAE